MRTTPRAISEVRPRRPGVHSPRSARGEFHNCGVKTGGALECWGRDDDGEATPPGGTFASVSAGGYHTCGVKTDVLGRCMLGLRQLWPSHAAPGFFRLGQCRWVPHLRREDWRGGRVLGRERQRADRGFFRSSITPLEGTTPALGEDRRDLRMLGMGRFANAVRGYFRLGQHRGVPRLRGGRPAGPSFAGARTFMARPRRLNKHTLQSPGGVA